MILLVNFALSKSYVMLTTSSETQGQIVGTRKSLNGGKNIWHEEKYRTARRAPGDNVLPDQFQTVVAVLPSEVFWHQSEGRTATTVWNWSGKTLSPGALLAVLYFSSCHIFFPPFRLFLVPTICPWVSEDVLTIAD